MRFQLGRYELWRKFKLWEGWVFRCCRIRFLRKEIREKSRRREGDWRRKELPKNSPRNTGIEHNFTSQTQLTACEMKNHFSVSGFLLSFQFYRRIINLLFGKSNKLINCTATTGHRSKTLVYPFIYCYFLYSVECRGLCMHNFGWKHHKYFKMLNWVLLIFEGRTCALSHKMTLCC